MTPLLKTAIALASVDDILEIVRLIPRLQYWRSESLQPWVRTMVRATNRPGHCLIGSPLYEAMVFGQVSDLGNRRPGVQISPSL